ncbi:putative pleckstrin-like proteiny domain-containing family J member [Sesbania bispinosa]|nr:putative pleckstrin-like proteiny domain-containing family J member [Sesbania bispinosa]
MNHAATGSSVIKQALSPSTMAASDDARGEKKGDLIERPRLAVPLFNALIQCQSEARNGGWWR